MRLGRHILSAAPHSTPQHFLRLKMLGLNICLKGVCDDLFGFCGGLWCFVVFSATLFKQMFNESILYRQSIELFRHKLWYKLNSPHMLYLYTCHTKLLSYR